MKDHGSDFKYVFLVLLALAVSLPILNYSPFTLLFIISFTLITIGSCKLLKFKSLKKWIQVPGKLIETEIGLFRETGQGHLIMHYYPMAYYKYNYNGNEIASNKYAYDHKSIWTSELEKAKKVISNLESLETVNVLVNPSNPHEAVLNIEITKNRLSHYWAISISGFILLILGIVLLIL